MGSGPIDNTAGTQVVRVNGRLFVLRWYYAGNGPYYQGTGASQ